MREVLVAKPGQAGKLAKMAKEAFSEFQNLTVMTDMTGQFNRVIMETKLENWNEVEEIIKLHQSNPKIHEIFKDYTELYTTGEREIYKVW